MHDWQQEFVEVSSVWELTQQMAVPHESGISSTVQWHLQQTHINRHVISDSYLSLLLYRV